MKDNRKFTRRDIIELLEKIVGKTLGEVDTNNVFARTQKHPKITGIAGDVIEQSVFGYMPDQKQEPDLIVDGELVELKTTGLRRSKTSKSNYAIEAKEPMSITVVSPNKIIDESFENSNLWHKLKSLLVVYYLYDSDTTVPAAEYANFPIKSYQFFEFSEQDKKIIENDWNIVRNYIVELHESLENPEEGYPEISKLREKMLYMDTAPKYPNPPRFRLKRNVVTAISQKSLGKKFKELSSTSSFSSYSELYKMLKNFTNKYQSKSIETIAESMGIKLTRNSKGIVDKQINEQIITHAFGVDTQKLRNIDTFAKIGIIPKTLTLTTSGGRTEDTKFDTIDFDEWLDKDKSFEQSSIYNFFAEHTLLFSIFAEGYVDSPLEKNIFKGFKILKFNEDFIFAHVEPVWKEVRNLLFKRKFKVTKIKDKKGDYVVNPKTGTIRDKTNFPKSRNNVIFLRGTSQDSTNKPLTLNGYQLYHQQYWIKGNFLVNMLEHEPFI